MELPFINKFQPIFLKDFEINNNLTLLLKSFVKMDSLNILLIGNTGSGKTSLINSIIKEYYGLIKNPKENILFINNLNEQGIQYYRNEVKTFCQTSSLIPNKKKLIVLDDLDLINQQSQQVFRNCIDKWGNNVNFICSCINIQKIIETLQSRLTIIKINPPTKNDLEKILLKICSIENIKITEEASEFLLNISNNSIRILINYLEKLKLLEKDEINIGTVTDILTNISFYLFENYINLCKEKKLISALNLMKTILDNGFSVMDVLDNFFIFVKTTKNICEETKYKIIKIICKYIIIFHNIHENEIELHLFTNNLINLFSNNI